MTKAACVSGKSIRNYVDNRLLALCIIEHSKELSVASEVDADIAVLYFNLQKGRRVLQSVSLCKTRKSMS